MLYYKTSIDLPMCGLAVNKVLIDLPENIDLERLILKKPSANMGLAVQEAMLDGYEDCIKWLGWSLTKPTLDAVEADCRVHEAEFILRDNIRYIIVEKNTGNVVGRCAFPSVQAMWHIPQFGISYFMRKSAQGKGYATEAVYLMTTIAFNYLKAQKVEIYCDKTNLASQRIPLKLGYALEYEQKGSWLTETGELADLQTYSMFSKSQLLKPGIKN